MIKNIYTRVTPESIPQLLSRLLEETSYECSLLNRKDWWGDMDSNVLMFEFGDLEHCSLTEKCVECPWKHDCAAREGKLVTWNEFVNLVKGD